MPFLVCFSVPATQYQETFNSCRLSKCVAINLCRSRGVSWKLPVLKPISTSTDKCGTTISGALRLLGGNCSLGVCVHEHTLIRRKSLVSRKPTESQTRLLQRLALIGSKPCTNPFLSANVLGISSNSHQYLFGYNQIRDCIQLPG